MNLDLVIVNDKVKPAICKAMNYKETLYQQFAKEMISKESKSVSSTKKTKTLKMELKNRKN